MNFESALIAGVVALFVSLIANYTQSRIAADQQRQVRRTQRHQYLEKLMEHLIHARIEHEAFVSKISDIRLQQLDPKNSEKISNLAELQEEYGRIIGEAIAACLGAGDEQLVAIAQHGLTPYFVDAETINQPKYYQDQDFKNRNRANLFDAEKILADIFASITRADFTPSSYER